MSQTDLTHVGKIGVNLFSPLQITKEQEEALWNDPDYGL
jgi:hypothetical protein